MQQQNERIRKENAALKSLTKATTGAPNNQRKEEIERWIKRHGEDFPTEAEELNTLLKAFADETEATKKENQALRAR